MFFFNSSCNKCNQVRCCVREQERSGNRQSCGCGCGCGGGYNREQSCPCMRKPDCKCRRNDNIYCRCECMNAQNYDEY